MVPSLWAPPPPSPPPSPPPRPPLPSLTSRQAVAGSLVPLLQMARNRVRTPLLRTCMGVRGGGEDEGYGMRTSLLRTCIGRGGGEEGRGGTHRCCAHAEERERVQLVDLYLLCLH